MKRALAVCQGSFITRKSQKTEEVKFLSQKFEPQKARVYAVLSALILNVTKFKMMILATSGQHSYNTRTNILKISGQAFL
ncbi:hypothetical protein [Eubacterium oxidoreducens]|uniref:hypothetical protein n=1 Tax=Eubacterium oxidoreducens TaxID=1732 RepID=UPI0015A21635|nr:hypothetical protein [Eubacterium oxidoreducens]